MDVSSLAGLSLFWNRMPNRWQAALLSLVGFDHRSNAAGLCVVPKELKVSGTESQRAFQRFYEILMALPKVSRRFFLQVIGKAAAITGIGGPKSFMLETPPQGASLRQFNYCFAEVLARLSAEDGTARRVLESCGLDPEGADPSTVFAALNKLAAKSDRSHSGIVRIVSMFKNGCDEELTGDDKGTIGYLRTLGSNMGLSPSQIDFIVERTGLRTLGLSPDDLEKFYAARGEIDSEDAFLDDDLDVAESGQAYQQNFAAGWIGAESPYEYCRESIYPYLLEESGRPERGD